MVVVQEPGEPLPELFFIGRVSGQDRLLEQLLLDVLGQAAPHVDHRRPEHAGHPLPISVVVHCALLMIMRLGAALLNTRKGPESSMTNINAPAD